MALRERERERERERDRSSWQKGIDESKLSVSFYSAVKRAEALQQIREVGGHFYVTASEIADIVVGGMLTTWPLICSMRTPILSSVEKCSSERCKHHVRHLRLDYQRLDLTAAA